MTPNKTSNTTAAAEDPIKDVHQRTIDGVNRCLRRLITALGRDYEHCGKASCARSRRCRGFACEPPCPARALRP